MADQRNQGVRKVSNGGVISTVAGTGTTAMSIDGLPPTSTALNAPEGLLLDPAGALWIGEYLGNRVRKLTPSGTIQPVAGNGTAVGSGAVPLVPNRHG